MKIPGNYIWRSSDVDYPVTVVENLGLGPDQRIYLRIAESNTAIPFDEVIIPKEPEVRPSSRKPIPRRLL